LIQEIDGVIYDTHAAERLSSYEFQRIGSWEWIFKVLYRTKNGRYFTYETGGCGTESAKRVGTKLVGGYYVIYTASDDEARRFLEQNNPDLALKLFKEFYEK